MCTSFISNGRKTLVGWNLDLLNMECQVVAQDDMVFIAVNDATEGWMPLFGANAHGDFVAMPTCWPFDERSNPTSTDSPNIIHLNIDLLLGKKTFQETRMIAESKTICSVPGFTFQSQLSDREGNVLQIVPGQGVRYLEKPAYAVMTNFSPFKGNTQTHPWMGWDRYQTAVTMLKEKSAQMDVSDCFDILRATSQTVCPTVISMVFDVTDGVVYWCTDRRWDAIEKKHIACPSNPL